MSTVPLAISCLTTSNLPWFMDLTFQVPVQYCFFRIGLYFYHQSYPQLGLFLLWFHLFILSGIISPLISCSILGTYWPGEFIFQCPIFLPFHTVHGVLKARILKWFAIPFSSGPHSVRHLHHDPAVLGGPMWLGFTELDKAVVRVIRLASFLWLWFQCVCPLMPSHNTYHLTWIYLTFYLGYLFMAAPAKDSCFSLAWMSSISSWPPLLTMNME